MAQNQDKAQPRERLSIRLRSLSGLFAIRCQALEITPSAYVQGLVQADVSQDTLSQFYACLHELHTLHEQLRRIGINLNQLARQANEGRLVAPDDFARVNAEISNQVDEVERVLRHVSTSSSVLARRTGKKARRPSA